MTPESIIGEDGLPSHSQVSRCESKEFQGGVACVGASPWGLPQAGLLKKARVSQVWPWVFRKTPWVFQKWPWLTWE